MCVKEILETETYTIGENQNKLCSSGRLDNFSDNWRASFFDDLVVSDVQLGIDSLRDGLDVGA